MRRHPSPSHGQGERAGDASGEGAYAGARGTSILCGGMPEGTLPSATFQPMTAESDPSMLPGGYNFIHLVFWTLVGMVAVGTNITVVILLTGLAIMALESVGKG